MVGALGQLGVGGRLGAEGERAITRGAFTEGRAPLREQRLPGHQRLRRDPARLLHLRGGLAHGGATRRLLRLGVRVGGLIERGQRREQLLARGCRRLRARFSDVLRLRLFALVGGRQARDRAGQGAAIQGNAPRQTPGR